MSLCTLLPFCWLAQGQPFNGTVGCCCFRPAFQREGVATFDQRLQWIIRHTAGAVSAFVGVLFPLYLLLLALPSSYRQTIDKYMPLQIGLRSISTVHFDSSSYLPLWGGIAVMAIYAALALGVGLILLERRDA